MLDGIVAETVAASGARVHAYCWMTNHLHALIQASDDPLAVFMQQIARRYARYRQRRLDTTGHLFERRYGARLIEDDPYFLAALRYIHLNPCKAHLARDPADYRWSSHATYIGRRAVPWVTTEFGLSLFHREPPRARVAYQEFMAAPIGESEYEDWPDGDAPPWRGRRKRPLNTTGGLRPTSTLEQIANDVCRDLLIDLALLRSPGRSRCLVRARVELARRATDGRIASLRQVAGYLGCTPSALSQLLTRYSV